MHFCFFAKKSGSQRNSPLKMELSRASRTFVLLRINNRATAMAKLRAKAGGREGAGVENNNSSGWCTVAQVTCLLFLTYIKNQGRAPRRLCALHKDIVESVPQEPGHVNNPNYTRTTRDSCLIHSAPSVRLIVFENGFADFSRCFSGKSLLRVLFLIPKDFWQITFNALVLLILLFFTWPNFKE